MRHTSVENKSPDFHRLKTLYEVSKKLSLFTSVEESFTDILECVSECFPLKTAILIEHWEPKPRMTVWHAENISKDIVSRSIENAKSAYSHLIGGNPGLTNNLSIPIHSETKCPGTHRPIAETDQGKYIILPLIIDYLPAHGAFQLEGTGRLNEEDLEFASALTNLVTIAFDRYNKTKREHEKQEEEAKRNLKMLYHTQETIVNLESERDLREAFVSLLIHDLITPLSVILGAAQMIIRKPQDGEAHCKGARMIENQANRAGKMIYDLLDANRIRGGEKIAIVRVESNIFNIVKTALTELAIVHGDRFHLQAEDTIQGSVDPRGIRRIIENLCNNAVKYGGKETPITVEVKDDTQGITLRVGNLGNVIPAEDQKSLFVQYRRSDSASSSGQKGWGIGLTLVRGVAEAHGGSVTVTSNIKDGTIFSVHLPH